MVDRDIDVLTDGLTMQTVAVIFDKNSHFLSLGETYFIPLICRLPVI